VQLVLHRVARARARQARRHILYSLLRSWRCSSSCTVRLGLSWELTKSLHPPRSFETTL